MPKSLFPEPTKLSEKPKRQEDTVSLKSQQSIMHEELLAGNFMLKPINRDEQDENNNNQYDYYLPEAAPIQKEVSVQRVSRML